MIKSDQLEPHIGIFWLLADRLILDTSSLSDAEPYGDCVTHPNSHIDFWTAQQRLGTVPRDVEYEEPPRGRVVYNTKTQRFALYADRCILTRKDVVREILRTMGLPKDAIVDTDPHYRCLKCMRGRDPSGSFS